MSAVVQLSPMPTQVDGSAIGVSLDAHRDEQLHSAWQSIFDQSNAIELGQGTTTGPDHPESIADRRHMTAPLPRQPAPATAATSAKAATQISPGARRRLGDDSIVTRAVTTDSKEKNPAATYRTMVSSRLHGDAQRIDVRFPGKVEVQPSVSQLVSIPSVTESAIVRVIGSQIAVVVRSATILDDEALQCAFETARELTGTRAGLLQLVVNGREVYCQPAESGSTVQPLFAC